MHINCEQSKLSSAFNGPEFRYIPIYMYIYSIFQVDRHSVNVLYKCSYIRVSKYPPNAIFRNANINAQRANVTRPNELAQ